MVINHNLNAMNSQRNGSLNLRRAGKSMEKLSSGLRINNASDDAAGLSISEKMRGQIRGLDQAARNSQDGISLIQTAEGALNETHSIIQRMRELAVQAANDTNTEKDRNEVQKEINQLTSDVNRIGNTTEFNSQKLLTSGVSKATKDNIIKGLKDAWLGGAEKRIDDFYGLKASGTPLKVVIDSGSPYDELAHVGGTSAQLELHLDASDFGPGTGVDGSNIHGKLYNDRIIAHEMTHAVMDDSLGTAKMNTMPTWFKEGTAEFMAGADERVRNVIGNSSGTGVDPTKLTSFINRAADILGGASWNGSDTDYAAGYVITKYLNTKLDTGKSMKTLMTDIKNDTGNNGKNALEAAITSNTPAALGITNLGDLKTKFAADAKDYIQKTGAFNANGMTLDWSNKDESDVGAIGGTDAGGATNINAEGVIDETKTFPASNFTIVWPVDGENSSTFNFQVGANEGQNITVQMKDMRAASLKISGQAQGNVNSSDGSVHANYTKALNNGVTNGTDNNISEYALDVSTSSNATAAIKIFDEAIQSVSSFRSELGAYQNRLEHTISNLNNSSENLSSAESRIRDVDMAKEMMTFSKENVLGQAAQAMLAQAKSQPEAVLQLLR